MVSGENPDLPVGRDMKQIVALHPDPWVVHAMTAFQRQAEEQVVHARLTELVYQGMVRLGLNNAMLGALMGMSEQDIRALMTGDKEWTIPQVVDAMYLMGCHLDIHMACDHQE